LSDKFCFKSYPQKASKKIVFCFLEYDNLSKPWKQSSGRKILKESVFKIKKQ